MNAGSKIKSIKNTAVAECKLSRQNSLCSVSNVSYSHLFCESTVWIVPLFPSFSVLLPV